MDGDRHIPIAGCQGPFFLCYFPLFPTKLCSVAPIIFIMCVSPELVVSYGIAYKSGASFFCFTRVFARH
jgi:hypothetical protein